MFKLKILFDDGSSEIVDEDFYTKEEAEEEYQAWLDGWNEGRDVLMEAGESYSDADIEGHDIWEE